MDFFGARKRLGQKALGGVVLAVGAAERDLQRQRQAADAVFETLRHPAPVDAGVEGQHMVVRKAEIVVQMQRGEAVGVRFEHARAVVVQIFMTAVKAEAGRTQVGKLAENIVQIRRAPEVFKRHRHAVFFCALAYGAEAARAERGDGRRIEAARQVQNHRRDAAVARFVDAPQQRLRQRRAGGVVQPHIVDAGELQVRGLDLQPAAAHMLGLLEALGVVLVPPKEGVRKAGVPNGVDARFIGQRAVVGHIDGKVHLSFSVRFSRRRAGKKFFASIAASVMAKAIQPA